MYSLIKTLHCHRCAPSLLVCRGRTGRHENKMAMEMVDSQKASVNGGASRLSSKTKNTKKKGGKTDKNASLPSSSVLQEFRKAGKGLGMI